MMVIDMTAQLGMLFGGLVAVFVIAAAGIVVSAWRSRLPDASATARTARHLTAVLTSSTPATALPRERSVGRAA
jgi:hypothetical protein